MTTSNPTTKVTSPRIKRGAIVVGIALLVLVLLVVATSILTGYGFRLLSFARDLPNLAKAAINSSAVTSTTHGDFRNIMFLHHSVGHNLIEQGSVRELFTAAGYQFWDHDYNYPGLTNPAGNPVGHSYSVPADNTDPDGLLQIFSQPVLGLPLNTLSGLMQHEVIAFKSCFPASDIASDAQLEERKTWYLKMRDVMDQHRDHIFVVVTQPPLNPVGTNLRVATRARAFANWLKSDEFLKGHANIFTFDLFGELAESNPNSPDFNMLREAYREGTDSHPNRIANETVGPRFVDFVINSIDRYRQARPKN